MPTVTKNTCQYKLQNGAKKGKLCGTPCKDDYCFRHKEKTLAKNEEYREKNKKLKTIEKVKEENDIKKLIPKLGKINDKIRFLGENMRLYKAYQQPLKLKINEINEKICDENIRTCLYGLCINKKEEDNDVVCRNCYCNKFETCNHCDDDKCNHCYRTVGHIKTWKYEGTTEQIQDLCKYYEKKFSIASKERSRLIEIRKIINEKKIY